MRSLVLVLALVLTTLPAFASGVILDFPNLTWPQGDEGSASTKGCVASPKGAVSACK